MENFFQDLRFGARLLCKRPGFTASAVLALALGIGGTTAIVTLASAVLLRPLPYPDSERLIAIWETLPEMRQGSVSDANFRDFRDQSTRVESMAAVYARDLSLGYGDEDPERVVGGDVSRDFFRVFAVEPTVGRTFSDDAYAPGRGRVAVLSHELWRRRFGRDPQVYGKTFVLNGQLHRVVGVMPADYRVAADARQQAPFDLFRPLHLSAEERGRGNHMLQVYGRLRPGVSVKQARAEMDTIAARLAQQYPSQAERGVRVRTLKEQFAAPLRPALLVLLGAVGLVLLIACANVGGLLLARGASRQGEFAIRLALGAGRRRIVRQLLTESLLLSLLGGGCGVLVALWLIDLVTLGLAEQLSRVIPVEIDLGILGFSLAVSVLTGLVFGILPALSASRSEVLLGLKDGGARATVGPGQGRLRRGLIVGELALAVTLSIGAGLMAHSFVKLQGVDPGFDEHNLLTFRVALPEDAEDREVVAFYSRLIDRLKALPGAQEVAAINHPPLIRQNMNGGFSIEGRPPWGPGEEPLTEYQVVTRDYFRAMKIPVVRGRSFSEHDRNGTTGVVVINETMANLYWPGEDPIGKRMRTGWTGDEWKQIVGVVADTTRFSLDNTRRAAETYFPFEQAQLRAMAVMVRTSVEPRSLVEAVRGQVRGLDATLPMYATQTMEQVVADSLGDRSFSLLLLCLFALTALVLAGTGIYGLLAYQVSQRSREVGIRMALGARVGDVRRLFVVEGAKLIVAGLLIGLGTSVVLARFLESLLYGVSAQDGLTFGIVAVLLSVIALVAVYVPARRASQIDPMVALRSE